MGKKRGRPTKYRLEFPEQLLDHMQRGKSFASFGAKLRVTRECLYEWTRRHKEFSDAKSLGDLLSLQWWEDLLQDGAQGMPCNVTATLFVLKCRHRETGGYRDKFPDDPAENTTTINVSTPKIDFSTTSDENLVDKLIQAKKGEKKNG